MVTARDDIDGLWDRWLTGRARADRDDLICHYLPLVRFLAGSAGRPLPPMVRAELPSFGVFGLIDAIERFDPTFNVRFESYASRRIKGAIGDGLRLLSHFPRGASARPGRIIDKIISIDFQTARTPLGTRLEETLFDPLAERPPDGVELAADHGEVVEAIALLPERDRFVIEQHYYERRTLKEIGAELGVTESRVCQLHRRALRTIGEALAEMVEISA